MAYELEKSIGFKINQTANKLNNKFIKILQAYDTAPEQRATLEIIKYEKEVNQTMIAEILAKDKTTISRTLAALEKKGFIKKIQVDKRTNHIQLTQLGEEILNKSEKDVKEFRASLTSNLTNDEVTQLITLLEKIAFNAREDI